VRVIARPPIPSGPYLVAGLARSGVAAALALAARGEVVIGVDAREPRGLDELRARGIELHLAAPAEDAAPLLERASALVKSPGVPAQEPIVSGARARGMPVLGELELGWRLLANEFVAVTGTNGKTTTVELIAHILRASDVPVVVAGNVGTALCSLVGGVASRDVVACEVSSFQLEDALCFAPEVAVLLNIAPDHLDRHGSMREYEAAKLRIFAAQPSGAAAVVPSALRERVEQALATPPQNERRIVCFGEDPRSELALRDGALWWDARERLLDVAELPLRGAHNVENAMAAAAACLARGTPLEGVREGLRSFAGVPHRLEEVATIDGVLYVNDSKATNVASTIVALDAFAGQRVHLILGGQGKGQDFSPLRAPVERSCAAVYLIGEDSEVIERALAGSGPPLNDCRELEPALRACSGAAYAGEVVLLSPACASFDQFDDFEARGERFRELVVEGLSA